MNALADSPKVPLELEQMIISLAIADYHSNDSRLAQPIQAILAVSKSWRRYALPRFYQRVFLRHSRTYHKFAKLVRSQLGSSHRKYVKEIVFNLPENQRTARVLKSNVIQTILQFCRRVRTIALRLDWERETFLWFHALAENLKVYADPVQLIFPQQTTSSLIGLLLYFNILERMRNLQELHVLTDVSAETASHLQRVPVRRLFVTLLNAWHGAFHSSHIPVDILSILECNAYVDELFVDYWCLANCLESRPDEEAITAYITRPSAPSRPRVHYRRVANLPRYFSEGSDASQDDSDDGRDDAYLRTPRFVREAFIEDQYSEQYDHLSDHESEEDPSDSEWERDTGLTQRVSNRSRAG